MKSLTVFIHYETKEWFWSTTHSQPGPSDDWVPCSYTRKSADAIRDDLGAHLEVPNPNSKYRPNGVNAKRLPYAQILQELQGTPVSQPEMPQEEKFIYLTGKDYPELCGYCRAAIDTAATIMGLVLEIENECLEDDTEGACNLAYDLKMFCGGYYCKERENNVRKLSDDLR